MCDPASIAIGIGGVTSAAGSIWKGSAESKAYTARAAELEQQAALRVQKGEFDADQSARKFERTRGGAYAGIGNTGLDIASFSDVLADSAIEAALEQKVIRFQAQQEAANLRAQAAQSRSAAKAAKTGSFFSAAGSLFGVAARIKF